MSKRKKAVKVIKRKRISYSVEQKIQVVTYAKEQGNSKAAEYFNINISMVGHQVIASSKWNTETNAKNKRVSSGQKAFFPKAKKRLYDWIIE